MLLKQEGRLHKKRPSNKGGVNLSPYFTSAKRHFQSESFFERFSHSQHFNKIISVFLIACLVLDPFVMPVVAYAQQEDPCQRMQRDLNTLLEIKQNTCREGGNLNLCDKALNEIPKLQRNIELECLPRREEPFIQERGRPREQETPRQETPSPVNSEACRELENKENELAGLRKEIGELTVRGSEAIQGKLNALEEIVNNLRKECRPGERPRPKSEQPRQGEPRREEPVGEGEMPGEAGAPGPAGGPGVPGTPGAGGAPGGQPTVGQVPRQTPYGAQPGIQQAQQCAPCDFSQSLPCANKKGPVINPATRRCCCEDLCPNGRNPCAIGLPPLAPQYLNSLKIHPTVPCNSNETCTTDGTKFGKWGIHCCQPRCDGGKQPCGKPNDPKCPAGTLCTDNCCTDPCPNKRCKDPFKVNQQGQQIEGELCARNEICLNRGNGNFCCVDYCQGGTPCGDIKRINQPDKKACENSEQGQFCKPVSYPISKENGQKLVKQGELSEDPKWLDQGGLYFGISKIVHCCQCETLNCNADNDVVQCQVVGAAGEEEKESWQEIFLRNFSVKKAYAAIVDPNEQRYEFDCDVTADGVKLDKIRVIEGRPEPINKALLCNHPHLRNQGPREHLIDFKCYFKGNPDGCADLPSTKLDCRNPCEVAGYIDLSLENDLEELLKLCPQNNQPGDVEVPTACIKKVQVPATDTNGHIESIDCLECVERVYKVCKHTSAELTRDFPDNRDATQIEEALHARYNVIRAQGTACHGRCFDYEYDDSYIDPSVGDWGWVCPNDPDVTSLVVGDVPIKRDKDKRSCCACVGNRIEDKGICIPPDQDCNLAMSRKKHPGCGCAAPLTRQGPYCDGFPIKWERDADSGDVIVRMGLVNEPGRCECICEEIDCSLRKSQPSSGWCTNRPKLTWKTWEDEEPESLKLAWVPCQPKEEEKEYEIIYKEPEKLKWEPCFPQLKAPKCTPPPRTLKWTDCEPSIVCKACGKEIAMTYYKNLKCTITGKGSKGSMSLPKQFGIDELSAALSEDKLKLLCSVAERGEHMPVSIDCDSPGSEIRYGNKKEKSIKCPT